MEGVVGGAGHQADRPQQQLHGWVDELPQLLCTMHHECSGRPLSAMT